VFLAGFAVEYLRSGDARRASEFANLAAGLNATLRGVEEVTKLGELLSAFALRHYGSNGLQACPTWS